MKSLKTQGHIGNSHGSRNALLAEDDENVHSSSEKLTANPTDPTKSRKESMHASLKLMSLRECAWKGFYRKIMKTTLQERGSIR